MEETVAMRKPIVVAPEQGRTYEMGRMRAVFKADLEESAHRYSVSEWWLGAALRRFASRVERDNEAGTCPAV